MKKDAGTPELQMKRVYQAQMGKDPSLFMVEKLEKQNILTIEHAVAGKRLYVWHYAATAQSDARAIDMSREVFGGHDGGLNLDKPMAADRYMKTMTQIRKAENTTGKPYGKILRAVCLDEMGLNELQAHLGKRKGTAREWMVEAFEYLVDAQQVVFDLDRKWRERNDLAAGTEIATIGA